MTDIVERLRARLQRDRLGRFDPELSIVIGPGIYQDIMEAAGTVEGLRDERNAMRAEIDRLRNDAQPVPSRSVLAAVIHDARWPADHQLSRYAFAEEDKNGQEYCYRIADAVLAALTSAERPQETAADNAALIAAIPEMVQVLKLARAHIDACDYDTEAIALSEHITAVLQKVKQP